MKKFNKPYNTIITTEKLLKAWQNFLVGKKKRNDVAVFQVKLIDNIISLRNDLLSGIYTHGKYHEFNISDPKPRNIHKATVRDRLLHHLIYQELFDFFDKKFIYDSYSCRREKGMHKALYRFEELSRHVSKNHTRTCWVLKCDIKKFFASIDHSVLKSILSKYISNNHILYLLNKIIDSFSSHASLHVGLPLGNLTSQLLVNVYMNEFDQFTKRELKIKNYIRYADDFVILSDNRQYLENLIPKISFFLLESLKLSLHPSKVSISTYASGVDFLGWVNFPHHRILRTATKKRMFKIIKESRKKETLLSYEGMLRHGNGYDLYNSIESLFKKKNPTPDKFV